MGFEKPPLLLVFQSFFSSFIPRDDYSLAGFRVAAKDTIAPRKELFASPHHRGQKNRERLGPPSVEMVWIAACCNYRRRP